MATLNHYCLLFLKLQIIQIFICSFPKAPSSNDQKPSNFWHFCGFHSFHSLTFIWGQSKDLKAFTFQYHIHKLAHIIIIIKGTPWNKNDQNWQKYYLLFPSLPLHWMESSLPLEGQGLPFRVINVFCSGGQRGWRDWCAFFLAYSWQCCVTEFPKLK